MIISLLLISAPTVDQAALKAAVKKNHPEIMKCYEPESAKDPKLQGEVHVGFQLNETAKVKNVAVKKTTLKNKTVETCLVKVVQGIDFPKTQGGNIDITYPFVFEPAIVQEAPPPVQKVPGKLPPDAVRNTIGDNSKKFKDCLDAERTKNPQLTGKLETQFLVETDGKVSEAKVLSTTLNNANVENCVLAALKTLQFPKPEGDTGVRINFPFNFAQ